jgi:hypothetical protein
MREVFALAEEFAGMPLDQIELLLESPIHKAQVGAVSVMDVEARRRRTPQERRSALFELYLRRHDRINTWDLVDRAAPHVVGGHLADGPRDILHTLARSHDLWERRTAIVATYFSLRRGELDDTVAIAEILLHDEHHFVHTAVGSWLREAGEHDRPRLLAFLDRHAATMPRTALRLAAGHLDKPVRAHYLRLARTAPPHRTPPAGEDTDDPTTGG